MAFPASVNMSVFHWKERGYEWEKACLLPLGTFPEGAHTTSTNNSLARTRLQLRLDNVINSGCPSFPLRKWRKDIEELADFAQVSIQISGRKIHYLTHVLGQ